MAVTKEQLADWRNNPVTQDLMLELQGNMEECVATLVRSVRDRDYDSDIFQRAYITVAKDVITFQPEIISEEDLREVEDVED